LIRSSLFRHASFCLFRPQLTEGSLPNRVVYTFYPFRPSASSLMTARASDKLAHFPACPLHHCGFPVFSYIMPPPVGCLVFFFFFFGGFLFVVGCCFFRTSVLSSVLLVYQVIDEKPADFSLPRPTCRSRPPTPSVPSANGRFSRASPDYSAQSFLTPGQATGQGPFPSTPASCRRRFFPSLPRCGARSLQRANAPLPSVSVLPHLFSRFYFFSRPVGLPSSLAWPIPTIRGPCPLLLEYSC